MLILMKMSRVYQKQITQFKERCSTLYFGNTSTALSERRWRPATWRSANMCLLVVADCSGIVTSGVRRHPGCSTGYESKQWVLNSEFRSSFLPVYCDDFQNLFIEAFLFGMDWHNIDFFFRLTRWTHDASSADLESQFKEALFALSERFKEWLQGASSKWFETQAWLYDSTTLCIHEITIGLKTTVFLLLSLSLCLHLFVFGQSVMTQADP